MSMIEVKCVDQTLMITNSPLITTGDVETDEVHFEFCSKWEGYAKFAVFWVYENNAKYKAIDESTGVCSIPSEVLEKEGCFWFGVFGCKTDESGEVLKRRTTEVLKYKVKKGTITEVTKPKEPTPDIYEQILTKYSELIAQSKVFSPLTDEELDQIFNGTYVPLPDDDPSQRESILAEVVEARGENETLSDRLNKIDTRIGEEATARESSDTALGARIDTETSTRESEVAELERVNAIQKYEIENLKAKAEGQIYRTEVVDTEAYSLDVPSSVAPYAEVQKIGGKSVVWNQLVDPRSTNVNGVTLTASNGMWTLSGTAIQNGGRFESLTSKYINLTSGHIYAILSERKNSAIVYFNNIEDGKVVFTEASNVFTATSSMTLSIGINVTKDTEYSGTLKIQMFDLTQMFGSGNEPTLEECKRIFSADYYPYDAGTIKSFPVKTVRSLNAEGTEIGSIDVSSVTFDFKSAGSAHDEWSNGKKTKRISAVDLGTLNWSPVTSGAGRFQSATIGIKNPSLNSVKANVLCPKYETQTANGIYTGNTGIGVNGSMIWIHDSSYTDPSTFKSAMSGVMLYYELDSPTEETVPEIDNYIQVEGGGTLTFESDETVYMPVPSTDRFVVDLTSTTEEETT